MPEVIGTRRQKAAELVRHAEVPAAENPSKGLVKFEVWPESPGDNWVVTPDGVRVFVCDSCLADQHLSYGGDHRKGDLHRRGCKNLSPDGKHQCGCNPEWPELEEVLKQQRQKH